MVAAPFAPVPTPLATYNVVQAASISGAVGGNLSAATGAGNTLIIYVVSNSATVPTVTLNGGTGAVATCGYWSAGHGPNYSGIFYCLNTPAGITGYTTSGIFGSSYREISGIVSNPIVVWNFAGNSTAGTTFSVPVPGAMSSGDFTTGLCDYSPSNGGNPYADGWTDDRICTNNGQTSYTTGTTSASGTMSSSIYDACSIGFKQANNVGTAPVNWTAAGVPASRNVTTGQGSLPITVAAAGDLLVLYTKVSVSTNFLTNVTGGGTTWTQALTGYTDNSGSPHVQQCWIAKAVTTGSVTLTLTYSVAIGATAVESVFQEFNAGTGPFSYTVDGTSTRNNSGAATYVTWPAMAPTGPLNGSLFIGLARVPAGGPFRNPSGPAVLFTDANNNPFIYALNMVASFQPQLWQTASTASYASALLIKATSLVISGAATTDTLDANATIGALGAISGAALTDTLDANASLTQTMALAGSSPALSAASGKVAQSIVIAGAAAAASSASGSITDKGAIAGSAAAVSLANGYLTPIVIGGSSAAVSSAPGTVFAILKTVGSAASVSSATGTIGRVGALSGSGASASVATGAIVGTLTIAGNSPTASSAVGTLGITSQLTLSGSSTTVSSASGTVVAQSVISGSAVTASHANGAITTLAAVVGNAVTLSGASGAVVLTGIISGLAAAASHATGTIGSAPPADASATSVSSASGIVVLEETCSGSSSTLSTAFGTVAASLAIAGSAAAMSAAGGNLGGSAFLVGSAAAASAADGAVTSTLAIAGASVSASAAAGTVAGTLALAGTAATSSSAAGTIGGLAALAGSAASASLAAGWLVGVLEIDGLAIAVSGGDGTVLPPYIAGLLPPEITGIVTVDPAPAVRVTVDATAASVLVSSVAADITVSEAEGTVFISNAVHAEVKG